MVKVHELGRTMLETLSVLAIVGVLSVGSFGIISRAMNAQKEAALLSDTADVARMAKRLSCQYDAAYQTYTLYLYKSNAYPENWTYNSTQNEYTGVLDVVYQIEGDRKNFNVILSELSDELCVKVATADWGTLQTSGFIGVAVTQSDIGTYFSNCTNGCDSREDAVSSLSSDYPMPIEKAVTHCSSGSNTVQLWYKGCR